VPQKWDALPQNRLEGTGKLAPYVQYQCHPVVDVADWIHAGQEAIGLGNGIS
jgi:hypothetical protein